MDFCNSAAGDDELGMQATADHVSNETLLPYTGGRSIVEHQGEKDGQRS